MRSKVYGQSKMNTCPFCHRLATHKNEQGVEVCYRHLKSALEEIRCTCGSWLEQRNGKFGTYFNCLHCGNINFRKAMEMKSLMKKNGPVLPPLTLAKTEPPAISVSSKKKEITISSQDVEFFD